MKAAASNVLGKMALGEDLKEPLTNLVTSTSTFLMGNFIPMVGRVLASLPTVFGTLLTQITSYGQQYASAATKLIKSLSSSIATQIPAMVQQGVKLVDSLLTGFTMGGGSSMMAAAGNLLLQIATGIMNSLPIVVNAASGIMNSLATGLMTAIPTLLSQVMPMLVQFSASIRENAGTLVDAGLNLINGLVMGLINSLPVLISTIPTIISNLAGIINDNAPKVLLCGAKIMLELALGIIQNIPVLVANLPKIFLAIIDVLTALNWINLGKTIVTGIKDGIIAFKGQVQSAGTKLNEAISNGLKNLPSKLKGFGRNGVSSLKSALASGVSGLRALGARMLVSLVGALKGMPGKLLSLAKSSVSKVKSAFKIDWKSIGTNIVKGIANGITGSASSIANAAKTAAKNALKSAKNFLGIKSPSKVFEREVGQYIPQGIAKGILGDDSAENALKSKYSGLTSTFGGLSTNGAMSRFGTSNTNNVTMNVNVSGSDDPEAWGRTMASEFERRLRMA